LRVKFSDGSRQDMYEGGKKGRLLETGNSTTANGYFIDIYDLFGAI